MAFASTTEFDVRTTGSDSNGGGFDTASSGVDYSQQDSPQITYTDLVIDGTTNTKCTSAGNPFTSSHVGNIINITGGTGFTVQRVQVVSVAAAVATCDVSLGTLGSTGGAGKLGGALLTLQKASDITSTGMTIHVKAGTYTLTTVVTLAGVNHKIIGYNTSHNDDGTKPLITTATNSTTLLQIAAGHIFLRNLSLSNTATTRASGINANGNFPAIVTHKCIFDGFTVCIDSSGGNFGQVSCFGTEFKNWTSASYAVLMNYRGEVHGCWFHNSTNASTTAISAANGVTVTATLFTNITGNGISFANGMSSCVVNCTFFAVAKNVIGTGSNWQAVIANNIFYSCASADGSVYVLNGGASTEGAQGYNAFGNCTSGGGIRNGNTYYHYFNDITLTVDPFTNSGSNDFTLNNTAGGGASCRQAGFQWGQ